MAPHNSDMTLSPSDPTGRKAALRAQALARRDALAIDDRLIWDEAVCERTLALLDEVAAPLRDESASVTVSAYWPMGSEADPRPILEALHARDVALCLPAIVDRRMIFRRWAPWEPIAPGGFGTLVPEAHRPEVTPMIVLAPLLAFDRRGYRIGYGKGYYDAALARLGPVASIGIAYARQEIDAVPDEPHDRRLGWVVTESGAIACG